MKEQSIDYWLQIFSLLYEFNVSRSCFWFILSWGIHFDVVVLEGQR